MSDHTPPTAERADFIQAMRSVASSVSVVTTDGLAGRHGATVSAFCSVSADPPTVLVCLKTDSRIAEAVTKNGSYCVNVLPQTAAEIANRFAGMDDEKVADRFDGIAHASNPLPTIGGATGFQTRITQAVASGSHTIFIGEVTAIATGESVPLTYLDGAYHRVVRDQS